ncbi:S8 family serine peptidase [Kitasatospora sp. LaBMicrA B282]|uniref:S8 family serine peptidase n=1 Tax=Kitasatospora sp. LaBMicrA B282 TaxID=3420949 RepID=UPI003D0C31E4
MSGRAVNGGRVSAAAGLCCVLLLTAAAGPAVADSGAGAGASPSPGVASGSGSSAQPPALPQISQTNIGYQSNGCVKPSGKNTDLTPWSQSLLDPQRAWPFSQGAGVTVAVLSTGVDGTSGVLGNRLKLGPHENGSGDAGHDCVGEGTFLAGLIAAKQQDGMGFAGLAPAATVLAVSVTDEAGTTSADLLAKGIRAAADAGARVIDVAVPVPAADGGLKDAVDYADAKGALVIAPAAPDTPATGGSGGGSYPAGYPEVLSVSDVGPVGAPAGAAPSAGSTPTRVDLVAPGDAVMSVGPGGAGFFTGTGPSFATAVVAGSAALVLGAHPTLTRDQLVHRLETTAYHPGTVLPDPRFGYGTVDPVAAVTAVLPEEQGATAPPPPRTAPLTMPPPVHQTAGSQAAAVAGGAFGVMVLVGLAALVLPRGARRTWRPGRLPADPPYGGR